MSAASAAEIADIYSSTIALQARTTASLSPWVAQLMEMEIHQALTGGQPWTGKVLPLPTNNSLVREAKYTAQDNAVRRLWQINRIVYDIDPDLWAELSHTDASTEIPEGLFEKLPHPDPFVALPVPLVIAIDETYNQRIEGFYVVGRGMTFAEVQVSTHAEAAVGNIGLLIGGRTETKDGKPYMIKDWGEPVQDMVWNRVTLRKSVRTVGGLIEDVRGRFDTQSLAGGFAGVPEAITACVSALIYLCATNAELRPLPSSLNRRKAKGQKSAKPPKVIQVGYISGPALRAYRRAERDEAAQPTGRTMRPHIRRAHFHTYRVGAGRTESIVKWLSPIPINVTDPAGKSTVVKVS